MISNDTIVALATPSGAGAIAVIRLSGEQAIVLAESIFESKSKKKLQSLTFQGAHILFHRVVFSQSFFLKNGSDEYLKIFV